MKKTLAVEIEEEIQAIETKIAQEAEAQIEIQEEDKTKLAAL